jgi:peptidoglycan hydrolase-like protein with peptidoglycan-binding domain
MLRSTQPSRHRLMATILSLVFVLAAVLGNVTPAAALAAWPTVRNGDSGPNVKTVQYLLRQRGSTITADGVFGPATESAVKSFQSANGLTADGIVGADTWPKLVVTVDVGSQGEAVKGLQVQLNKHGYTSVAVDGVYGNATGSAVTDFKSKHYLSGGTTVGATTWQELTGSGGGSSGGYSLPVGRSVVPRSEYDDPHHTYPAIDLQISTGTAVYAIKSGTATRVNNDRCGYGYSVAGDDGATYVYCHFSQYSAANGARVNTGQLLGYSGASGRVTGPHLHLEVIYGQNRCPQRLLLAIYDGVTVPHPSTLPTSGCVS